MNSDELRTVTQQLADVELPPAPDWQPLIVAAIVVVIALLLAVAVIYLHSRRKHSGNGSDATREALHQLQQLQLEWQQQKVDDHDAAYRLATLLRLGLELNQLSETPPPSLTDQKTQWQMLLQQLAQLRYTATNSHQPLTTDAFSQVEQWLKQAHTPC